MNTNRNFKNGVFTTLFDNPDLLRELYCALKGISLPSDIPVSINTLENVLFLDFNNDISFEIGGKLVVLIEHQSTINPNMALRLLLYVARVLEKRIKGRTLYSKKTVSIPWPEFYVLYNGREEFPDEQIYRLSELFEKPENPGFPENSYPLLELEVKVLNINEGRNGTIVSRCKELSDYAVFTAKVYTYCKETGDLEEAIKKAIKYCEKHDILAEYLQIHGSEVLNMILNEWSTEDAIAFAREEGREDGLEKGREEGREEKLRITRNLLAKGSVPEFVSEITGFSLEEIGKLQTKE